MRKIGAIFTAITLAGCASSGVIPFGQDTYMVTKKSAGGMFVAGSQVKADLYIEANEYCARSGKTVETVSATSQNAIPLTRMPNAELQFRCAVRAASAASAIQ